MDVYPSAGVARLRARFPRYLICAFGEGASGYWAVLRPECRTGAESETLITAPTLADLRDRLTHQHPDHPDGPDGPDG